MVISKYLASFAGLPVRRLANVDLPAAELPAFDVPPVDPAAVDPAAVAWRVDTMFHGREFADDIAGELARLLDGLDSKQIRALVVGAWSVADDTAPVELLVSMADRLPGLRALFLGDMTVGDSEISWIELDDITPLLTAYPALEVLRVRGSDELRLDPLRHDALRELVFESAGLPRAVGEAVAAADFPVLEHLELWLGPTRYGDVTVTVEQLAPILAGAQFPRLRHLGLRDAETADDLAAALAAAPVVARLWALDLSLGTLSDAGAEALLAGQPLTHLKKLDLHHHFLSEGMAARIAAELPGVAVDVSDRRDPRDGEHRYVAVSE